MGGIGGSLALASGVTIALLFGMVFVLGLSLVLIAGSDDPVTGLAIAIFLTIVFNLATFFLSPFIMDLVQSWLYKTRWVDLAEIEQYSPETGKIIRQVCQQKNLKTPRLGIINDQNPTAFTYGSLPNSARLVVSQGLFTYLDDDEIATVYAHELGHIVHWDFAVMTVASTLVQICYLVYSTARRLGSGRGDSKRVRALSTYAEQLGLPIEFDMGQVIAEGKTLNKNQLYGNFFLDIVLYGAETIGFFVGVVVGFVFLFGNHLGLFFGAPLIGVGIGMLVKTFVMFPDYSQAPETDILTLMSDPYASPLRGKPAQLEGQLIGRGDAGYKFGSDLKIQDRSGLLYLHYASRFGPIGNFLFGMKRVNSLIGQQVATTGWFRRGVAPWMDLIQLTGENGTVVNSYHRFWSFILGSGLIILGIACAVLLGQPA
jgi:hypothetical protein